MFWHSFCWDLIAYYGDLLPLQSHKLDRLEGNHVDSPLRTLELGLWGPDVPGAARRWPPEEFEVDRWARARELGFGEDSCVHRSSYIYGDVKAGSHVWVGPFTLLDASGGLEIGDFTMICAGVQVYSHDSVRWTLSGGRRKWEEAPVRIGTHCYVGAGTIVTRGVTIGDYTVIGAGSVVTRDLPAYSLAAGSPCKLMGKVIVDPDGAVNIVRGQ